MAEVFRYFAFWIALIGMFYVLGATHAALAVFVAGLAPRVLAPLRDG